MKDLKFIEEVMELIEKEEIPAPSPIEQRWSASSKSLMSPASSESNDDIFSWVSLFLIKNLLFITIFLQLTILIN